MFGSEKKMSSNPRQTVWRIQRLESEVLEAVAPRSYPRTMAQTMTVDSPLGPLRITAANQAITSVAIGRDLSKVSNSSGENSAVLERAATQLSEYFAGSRRHFELPVAWEGTPFQKSIWHELERIPYGQVVTYQELGTRVGAPQAARAVGGAVGKNPIPIIVACHRVMGSSGRITGYSAGEGIPTKKWLLTLEGITYR
jgi:methylated-DNA-[protein]-cysteine S-methyltransferase